MTEANEAPLPAKLGPYQVIRRLGRGSSGQVLLATPALGGPAVALKVLRQLPSGMGALEQERFRHGLALARRLHHPNIAQVFDDGLEPPWIWVAMELLPGCSLERYAAPSRLLPETLVLSIGVRLARALGHAHQQGVLHRDVKPANVVVQLAEPLTEASVKLTDFGLSSATDATRTQTGVVLGSPAYMAPEVLAGGAGSAASDIYSLGVLLFQLLTGQLPHEDAQLARLLMKVAREPAPRADELNPERSAGAADAVARALAKPAQERYRSALDFADALAAAAASTALDQAPDVP